MESDTAKRYAPYLAWRTFFNLILQMEEKGLPQRIDRSFLTGRSGADQTYLIATLKSWGLIDENGVVLDALKHLVQDKDERQAHIGTILRLHYPEVFGLAGNATQAQMDETFREAFGLQGNTRRKAETFFLHASAFAGLKLSAHFKAARTGGSATTVPRRKRAVGQSSKTKTPVADAEDDVDSSASKEGMKRAYFDLLVEQAKKSDKPDTELLDRIEKLLANE